jgi:monooxygenase
VTMLQRSPTYIVSLPARDKISAFLQRFLPGSVVYELGRVRNIGLQRALYAVSQRYPRFMRDLVVKGAAKQLRGSADVRHFVPRYNPWDQRLCVVPDGDLFRVIRDGKVTIATDEVETFTETGIRLRSGAHLDADVIITATGLSLQLFGGATIEVDGEPLDVSTLLTYKAVLLENLPNAALIFGYVNASWTLKADLAARYLCRLLNHLDATGNTQFVARAHPADRTTGSMLDALKAGYVHRGAAHMPRQGTHGPWKVRNNYLYDARVLRYAPIDDGVLHFTARTAAPARSAT